MSEHAPQGNRKRKELSDPADVDAAIADAAEMGIIIDFTREDFVAAVREGAVPGWRLDEAWHEDVDDAQDQL